MSVAAYLRRLLTKARSAWASLSAVRRAEADVPSRQHQLVEALSQSLQALQTLRCTQNLTVVALQCPQVIRPDLCSFLARDLKFDLNADDAVIYFTG